MAEKTAGPTAEDDLDLKPSGAGAMFRAEMFFTNVALGYWKHALALIVTVLLSVLLWGKYQDYHRRSQREASAQIAVALALLPEMTPNLSEKIARGETIDVVTVEKVGDQVLAVANGASSTARVEGYLTAAELFRLAGKADKQRAALTSATSAGKGVLEFASESGLANLELGTGEGEDAVKRLTALSASSQGFLAEQATINLALALESLGKKEEAGKVYTDFLARFPESLRTDEVKQRQARVTSGGGAG